MEPNDVTAAILDTAYQIHRDIGPGLSESVYELIPADALEAKGFKVVRQFPIPIQFGGKVFTEGFRADLIVNDCVIVEIKSIEQLVRLHKKQVLTYLKLSGISLSLLINFGGELLKGNFERLVVGVAPDLKQKPSFHSEGGETSSRTLKRRY